MFTVHRLYYHKFTVTFIQKSSKSSQLFSTLFYVIFDYKYWILLLITYIFVRDKELLHSFAPKCLVNNSTAESFQSQYKIHAFRIQITVLTINTKFALFFYKRTSKIQKLPNYLKTTTCRAFVMPSLSINLHTKIMLMLKILKIDNE